MTTAEGLRKILAELASKEDGKWNATQLKENAGGGVKRFATEYILQFLYKGVTIELKCDFGKYDSCVVYALYPNLIEDYTFSIHTKSQFFRLFSRSKAPFTVRTANDLFRAFLKQNRSLELLEKLARDTQFEPEVRGDSKNGNYLIEIRYSLSFKDKLSSIEPVIELQKSIVDYLIRRAELSP